MEDFVNEAGKGGHPLVMEATNSPFGFQDAVRASRIGGRVVLAGIPDGDAYTLSASEARRRGLKIKFVRRMGDDFPRAIDLVSSDRVNVRALVTPLGHKGPQAIESAVTAARRHFGPGATHHYLGPKCTNFTSGWSRRI